MVPILAKKQKGMTPYQTKILMKEFNASHFLTKEQQNQLARSLNVSEKRIAGWFARRRFNKRQEGLLAKSEYC